jgi:hypothetical protein
MEKVVAFCNRITPSNWNVAIDPDGFQFKGPRMLNIMLVRLDHFVDGWCYALKKGRMEILPVSRYAANHAGASRALRLYGDHIVAKSEIWLYPEGCAFYGDNVFAAAVHEIAHVAVDRFRMRQGKTRPGNSYLHPSEKDLHGPLFCRAFENLIRRTAANCRDRAEILASLHHELKRYQHGSGAVVGQENLVIFTPHRMISAAHTEESSNKRAGCATPHDPHLFPAASGIFRSSC